MDQSAQPPQASPDSGVDAALIEQPAEVIPAVPASTEAAADGPASTEAAADVPASTEAAADVPASTEATADRPASTEAAKPAPGAHAAPARRELNYLGIAGLALSVLGVLCLPVVGSILGMVLGRLGMRQVETGKVNAGYAVSRAAYLLGLATIVVTTAVVVLYVLFTLISG